MLLNIISHTPLWVFVLLLALVLIGSVQAKPRTVTLHRVMILPLVMFGLSLAGVIASYGFHLLAFAAWSGGLLGVIWMASNRIRTDRVSYNPATRELSLPGSWWPLALMMLIFAVKYVSGAVTAINPELARTAAFTMGSCALYGGLSGAFLARAIPLWRLSRRATAPMPASA
ncbi:MAG: DUF6622 family protein [Burkholderiaceae bacterium]